MENSRFQFKGFSINRSLIERNNTETSSKLKIVFDPEGFIDKENSTFQLHLGVQIEDENKSVNLEIDSVAKYVFENKEALEALNNYFFINAPALLFPYIRAYISTLTNLSGFEPINLPTLNMTQIGEDLKANTKEIKSSSAS